MKIPTFFIMRERCEKNLFKMKKKERKKTLKES
jgi:hypothetical protein